MEENRSEKRIDLLKGNIAGALFWLSIPIMGTQFIEMAYNLFDTMWVGQIGNQAVTAVGVAGSFMWLGSGIAMIPQIDNGLEITFTAGMHTGCTKVYTKPDSGISSVADLKGKKIGVPSLGDSSVIALKRALFDEGIGSSTNNMEVEWVVYGLTDLPLALENGAIDVAALHDPVAYNAETEYGFSKILDLSTDPKFENEYCCMSFVTTRLANENPKAAAAYTRAILRASAFVQADPAQAAKLQADNFS